MKKGTGLIMLVVPLVVLGFPIFGGSTPVMVEKNLFAQDRKPPSPDSVAPAPQANKPSLSVKAFQLDGIIIHGNTKKALVRLKSGGPPGQGRHSGQSPYVIVSEGGQLGDYRVAKVELKSITLEKDGQMTVVNLFSEGKVSPPAPAGPAPFNPAAGGQPPQPGAGAPGPQGARGPRGPMPGPVDMSGANAVPGENAPNAVMPHPDAAGGQSMGPQDAPAAGENAAGDQPEGPEPEEPPEDSNP